MPPDVFTPEKRSAVMARIRGSGNKATELRLMAIFRAHGITGWRRNQRLFGRPDFVFRRERVAVFVDGCFWHGYPRHATQPATRAEWWAAKLARNARRDRAVTRALRAAGWKVLRVWECALRPAGERRTVGRLWRALGRGNPRGVRCARGVRRGANGDFSAVDADFPAVDAAGAEAGWNASC